MAVGACWLVLLGELLGPVPTRAETGRGKASPHGDSLPKNDRERFRTLAAHISMTFLLRS